MAPQSRNHCSWRSITCWHRYSMSLQLCISCSRYMNHTRQCQSPDQTQQSRFNSGSAHLFLSFFYLQSVTTAFIQQEWFITDFDICPLFLFINSVLTSLLMASSFADENSQFKYNDQSHYWLFLYFWKSLVRWCMYTKHQWGSRLSHLTRE